MNITGPDYYDRIAFESVIPAFNEITARSAPEKMYLSFTMICQGAGNCVFPGMIMNADWNPIVFAEKPFKNWSLFFIGIV